MPNPKLLKVELDTYPDNEHNRRLEQVGEVRFRVVSDEGVHMREVDFDNDRILCNLKYMSCLHLDDEFGHYVKLDGAATKVGSLDSMFVVDHGRKTRQEKLDDHVAEKLFTTTRE